MLSLCSHSEDQRSSRLPPVVPRDEDRGGKASWATVTRVLPSSTYPCHGGVRGERAPASLRRSLIFEQSRKPEGFERPAPRQREPSGGFLQSRIDRHDEGFTVLSPTPCGRATGITSGKRRQKRDHEMRGYNIPGTHPMQEHRALRPEAVIIQISMTRTLTSIHLSVPSLQIVPEAPPLVGDAACLLAVV
jgi:hypothetical protein